LSWQCLWLEQRALTGSWLFICAGTYSNRELECAPAIIPNRQAQEQVLRLFGSRIPRILPILGRRGSDIVSDSRLRSNERFLQHLAFGFPFDHAKALETVTLLKTWKSDWTRVNLPGDDEHALILRLLTAAVQRVLSGAAADRPITMGISSGYDSRAILFVLRRLGIAPSTYTYGQVGNFDFDFCKELAPRLGVVHAEIDTSKCNWQLETFDRYVSTSAQDVVISPRVIAEKVMNESLPCRIDLHGFLNGGATGSFSGGPATDWSAAIAAFCKRNDAFAFQRHLGVDASAFLPRKPLAASQDLPFGQQLAIAYRVFQRIRPVPIGHPTPYVFPIEDCDWMGFWLNRSPAELAGQSRYIQFLRELRAPEFHEFEGMPDARLRSARWRKFYKEAHAAADGSKTVLPRHPGSHFCAFACFANNVSFRDMVAQSLVRLRKRNVIKASFIDKVFQLFTSGDILADQMLKGLVTTDLVLEANRFQ